jgi:gliding motility-associated-like protein
VSVPGDTLTVDWYDAPVGGTLLHSSDTMYSPDTAGMYFAEAREIATGCTSDRISVSVIEYSRPVATTSDVTVCENSSLRLSGGPAGMALYAWSGPDGYVSTLQQPVIAASADTSMRGPYRLIVENNNGCRDTATADVTVNPIPTITITREPTCSADLLTYSVTVEVSAGNVESTTGTLTNTGGNTWEITGISSGNLAVITVTSNNCSNDTSVLKSCDCDDITAPTSDGDTAYCAGNTIPTISARVQSGYTIDWYDAASGGNRLLEGNASYTPDSAGTYYAEARETATGCVSDVRTPVLITEISAPSIDAGDNDTICSGDDFKFSPSGTEIKEWSWEGPDGFSEEEQKPEIVSADTSASGIYRVTAKDTFGCTAVDSMYLHVKPTVEIDTLYFTGEDSVRYYVVLDSIGEIGEFDVGVKPNVDPWGNNALCLPELPTKPCPTNLPAPVVQDTSYCADMAIPQLAASHEYDYEIYWYDSTDQEQSLGNGTTYTPEKPGVYAVKAQKGLCETPFSYVHVTEHPVPEITIEDVKLCKYDEYNLQVEGKEEYMYIWKDENEIEIKQGRTYYIENFEETTVYYVTAENQYQCTTTDTVNVKIKHKGCLLIPTAFSPNNDGINETWEIDGLEENPDYDNAIIEIYDRWGELLYREKYSKSNAWDGTYKGKKLPVDSYHFIIDLMGDGEKVITGQVTILR